MKETGCCPFCGQEVMIHVPEGATEDDVRYQAARHCNCLQSTRFRRKEEAKEEGKVFVASVLTEDVNGERISCRVIPFLQGFVEHIVEGDVRSISVSVTPEISVKLKWNEKAWKVDVERKETLTTKA